MRILFGGRLIKVDLIAFKLKELGHWNIVKFINGELGEAVGARFYQDVNDQLMDNLLSSPFFLVYLISIYQKENRLPISKLDLFEKLMKNGAIRN